MDRRRTTARGVLLLLFLALAVTTGATAAREKGVPQLIFPVVGDVQYTDDFGAPRPGGAHQGNDLLAAKKAPAVAAESGTVEFWATSANAGCMLYLHGSSGTTYLYIHLNNDLTMKNDNRGKCGPGMSYAAGLRNGARVAAGQLIGFVGDSGDADGSHAHLHFEVHPNGGKAVDPFPFLKKAQRLLFYAKPGSSFRLALTGKVVANLAGSLTLKISKLTVWPSKQTVTITRTLVLSMSSKAKVELAPVGPIIGTLTPEVKPGIAATVWTAPAPATLEAQRGDDDALVAARIIVAAP